MCFHLEDHLEFMLKFKTSGSKFQIILSFSAMCSKGLNCEIFMFFRLDLTMEWVCPSEATFAMNINVDNVLTKTRCGHTI